MHQRKNPKQVSYEVFFQNPSGVSEELAAKDEEEDDLLEHQNKSATMIDEENDQINIVDEIEGQHQNDHDKPQN